MIDRFAEPSNIKVKPNKRQKELAAAPEYETKGLVEGIKIKMVMAEAEAEPKLFSESTSNRSQYRRKQSNSNTQETIEAKAERLLRLGN